MIDTFKDIYEYLKVRNLAPKLHILDNECSKAVQKYVKSEKVEIRLVEPHKSPSQCSRASSKSNKISHHLSTSKSGQGLPNTTMGQISTPYTRYSQLATHFKTKFIHLSISRDGGSVLFQ